MSADWCTSKYKIEPYSAPEWAQHLPHIPKNRIRLAHLPTPIHKWCLPGVPDGFEVFIKRDDLTGCTLSGNKIRKLEFILAEGIEKGCKHVVTCGGSMSNHCRATSASCAQIGLKCHMILQSSSTNPDDYESSSGNMFYYKMSGADMYLIGEDHPGTSDAADWAPMLQLAEKIKETTGENPLVVPAGGANTTGAFGYIEAFNELLNQGMLDKVTDIVFAGGSGGTMAGLAVANHLATNSAIRMHSVRVSDGYSAKYLHDHCNMIFKSFGIDLKSEDVVSVVDNYVGPGYTKTTDEELERMKKISMSTGIILDPTYTAKAAQGLIQEMQNNPTRFKGNRILFLHTGGILGAMGHPELLESMKNPSSKICAWSEAFK